MRDSVVQILEKHDVLQGLSDTVPFLGNTVYLFSYIIKCSHPECQLPVLPSMGLLEKSW